MKKSLILEKYTEIIYFGHKHLETRPSCSLELVTFLKYHMPLRLKRPKQLFELGTRSHFAVSFLMLKCSFKMLTTDPIDNHAASSNSRTVTFGSSNTISWIFDDFWGTQRKIASGHND